MVAGKLLLASMRRLRPAWNYELKDLLDMEMVGAPVLHGVGGVVVQGWGSSTAAVQVGAGVGSEGLEFEMGLACVNCCCVPVTALGK